MKRWTMKELKILKQNRHLPDGELTAIVDATPDQIKCVRFRHGIKKITKGFQKGNVPWNSGINYNAGGRSIQTRFKKGHTNKNARPLYNVFECQGYLFIKIPGNRHYPFNRWIYEQLNSPLSQNEIVTFRDKNPLNCSPENLIKITQGENVRRNANREKAAEGLRKTWAVTRAFEDYGLRSPNGFGKNRPYKKHNTIKVE